MRVLLINIGRAPMASVGTGVGHELGADGEATGNLITFAADYSAVDFLAAEVAKGDDVVAEVADFLVLKRSPAFDAAVH